MTKIEIIKTGDTDEKYFYNEARKKFHIKGKLNWNATYKGYVDSIDITIVNNQDPDNKIEIEDANLCKKKQDGVTLKWIEFHAKINKNPSESKKLIIDTKGKLEIKKDTYIFINLLIYQQGEKIKKCHFGFGGQPDVKDGNIIIGGED